MDVGRLAGFISTYFKGDRSELSGRLGDFDLAFSTFWKGFFPGHSEDAFFQHISKLPDREAREVLKADYLRIFGFDKLLEQLPANATTATAGDVIIGANELGFRTFRPATMAGEKGFGRFTLPRRVFTGGQQEVTPEMLAIISRSFEIDPLETGPQRFSTSGKITRMQFFEQQAAQINAMRRGDIDFANKVRAVVDIETAGLHDEGIWQVSVRTLRGDQEIAARNILMDNSIMDMGIYAREDGTIFRSFKDFYNSMHPGARWQTQREGLKEFLRAVQDVDYIVAQNAPFDMSKLVDSIRRYGLDADEELGGVARRFLDDAISPKVIDTLAFSNALIGDRITIAPELQRLGQFTPGALENIMLQTSLLSDIETRMTTRLGQMSPAERTAFLGDFVTADSLKLAGGNQVRAAIYGRIQRGLHFGDIDTFFEDQLLQIQEDIFRTGSETLLRNQPITNKRLRELITGASAITPTTRLAGVGVTPIELMAAEARRSGQMGGQVMNARSLMMNADRFTRWVNDVVGPDGSIRPGVRLNSDETFDLLRRAAVTQGHPFAGLSSFEQVVSSLLGQASGKSVPQPVKEARKMVGGVLGAIVESAPKARVFGGRNVALPLELLRKAEAEGIISTNFAGGLNRPAQVMRWSPFSFGQGERDIALVADIFDNDEQIRPFIDWLRRYVSDNPESAAKYGLDKSLPSIEASLLKYGRRYGVQLGVLGGKGDAEIQRIARLLDERGFGVDAKNMILQTRMVRGADAFDDAFGLSGRFIHTTASMVDLSRVESQLGRIGLPASFPGETLDTSERVVRDVLNEIPAAQRDNAFWGALRFKQRTGGSNVVQRIYDTTAGFLPKIKRVPKTAWAGVFAVGALLAATRGERNDPSRDTFDFQGFEDEDYYEQYLRSLGETQIATPARAASSPLNTAYVVQDAYQNRIGHQKMGYNSGRYNHLYGGG